MKTDAHETPTLPPELFAQLEGLSVRTRRLVTSLMAGEYATAFKGRGMEFEQVREYQPGDDIRQLDWNVSARTGVPHVKVHREERELTVMLVVDLSASEAFGTRAREMREVAVEVAALLALLAAKNNDRVGLVCFTSEIEKVIPPKKGRGQSWRVVRELLTHQPRERGTNLTAALELVARITKHRAVIFVLSDFRAEGYDEPLKVLARRHDVAALVLSDPRDLELPDAGLLTVHDPESGEVLLVDSSSRMVREQYAARGRAHATRRDELFASARVDRADLSTDGEHVRRVVELLRRREARP